MDKAHSIQFGERLKLLREEKGVSLRAAGEATDMSGQYLWSLERAVNRNIPSPEKLRRLSRYYAVAVEDLLADAGYLEDPEYEDGDEERSFVTRATKAFMHVINDPRFPRGGSLNPKEISHEGKLYIVELYQRVTGQKLL